MRKIFLIVVLSTALFSIVKAQGTSSGSDLYKGWSAYLNLGLTQPYTDLNRFQYFATWKQKNENRPGFTLGVRKMFSSVVGLQADISAGQILGDFRSKGLTGSLVSSNGNAEYAMYTQEVAQALWGTNKPKESVYFKTPYWQGAISAYIDLNNLGVSLFNARKGMLVKRRLAFYSYVGLGVISFDSKIYSLTTDSAYHKYLAGVSGKSMEAVVPVAIGAKYKINNKWNIGLEYKLNNVMSDKLDAFVNNSTGIYLRQGNYDKYGFASVALTYNFVGSNPSAENIEWVNPLTDKADQKVPTAAEILADAVTFGVAPGMILFKLLAWAFAQKTNALDTNVAFFYPAFLVAICGVIRLARFNITEGKPDRFSGVPIPAMALFVACLPMIVLYDNHPQISTYILNTNVLYGLIALLSWLMISKEQLFKLSPKALDFKKNLMRWIFLGLALISIILLKWSAALVLLPLYWLCSKIEFSFLNKTEE